MNEKNIKLEIAKIKHHISSMDVAAESEDYDTVDEEADILFELINNFEKKLITDRRSLFGKETISWRDNSIDKPSSTNCLLFVTKTLQVFEGFYDKDDNTWFRYRYNDCLDDHLVIAWADKPAFSIVDMELFNHD